MLTGIVDVDKQVLYTLPLHQLQQTCSINQSTYQLCQNDQTIQRRLTAAAARAKYVMDELSQRYSFSLNMKNPKEKLGTMINILQWTVPFYRVDDDNFNHRINNITMYNYSTSSYLVIHVIHGSRVEDFVKKNHLYEFLRHLFYDDLIL